MQLDHDHAFETMSLSPDLWIGIGHGVTLGIAHSDASVDRIQPGGSICVRRVIRDGHQPCDRAYHGAILDVRWATHAGPLEIAPRARLALRDVDPNKPATMLGAIVRWRRGRFAIWGDPYLRIGLANTELGNRTALVVPIYAGVSADRFSFALHTGYGTDLAVARDGFHVPIGAIAAVTIDNTIVSLEAGFSSALGPQNNGGFRALIAMLSWRS
jgi:hypothetical protein